MHVEAIQSSFSDNTFYLLHQDGADGILIDPIDAERALQVVRALGVEVRIVLNTHSHPDHIGGNQACIDGTGARLAAHPDAAPRVGPIALPLQDGDHLSVGQTRLDVLYTPGHTMDHISLAGAGQLFCGDTLFVGGVGNCRFGGDPRVLFETVHRLRDLDPALLLAPGHDYARRNLAFALHVDPDNHAAQQRLARLEAEPQTSIHRATLAEELTWSPFLRAWDPELQERVRTAFTDVWSRFTDTTSDALHTFLTLRAMRDVW